MYTLRVYQQDDPVATETLTCDRAADVLEAIPRLLARHARCERIEVHAGALRLFSVDCEGNRRPD